MNRLLWRLRWWWFLKRNPLPEVTTATELTMAWREREKAFLFRYDRKYRLAMEAKAMLYLESLGLGTWPTVEKTREELKKDYP